MTQAVGLWRVTQVVSYPDEASEKDMQCRPGAKAVPREVTAARTSLCCFYGARSAPLVECVG
jgi:hypothetical protein